MSSAEELAKLFPGRGAAEEPASEKRVTTDHVLELDGHRLEYTATAGTYRMKLDEKPEVELFYTAYVAKGGDVRRPVTFAFNGGPGSASVWLHMGFLGPKRVVGDVDDPPRVGVAGANPHTLLTTSDLVFIDPTSTGFSRPKEGKGREYHGVKADIQSVGELVRRWVTENGRWASPKYLAGESYGTVRAVGLARHLQERIGMDFDGLVLISIALKFGTLLFQEGNLLPYVLLLPAAAATAHYHGRVDGDSVWALHDEAERFAIDTYLPALMRGDRLSEADRQAIAGRLAELLGLTKDYVLRCDLRVDLMRFCRELLREERRTVGRLDSRFVGREKDAAGEHLENDPSLSALMGAYSAALHHHLHAELGYADHENTYEILNRDVWPWTFDEADNAHLDMSAALRDSLNHDQHLRVFVASGLYDLATPWAAAEYTLSQLQVEPERRAAITSRCYPAGHMMYIHEDSAAELRADLEHFYAGSTLPATDGAECK